MNVDVIFAASSTEVAPTRQATSTIPIVFAAHADPVGVGHVASLARPLETSPVCRCFSPNSPPRSWSEAMPQATRIAILWNPTTPSHQPALQAIDVAGKKLGVQLLMFPVRVADDFEPAFSAMPRDRVDAFLEVASPLLPVYRASSSPACAEPQNAGDVRAQYGCAGRRSHELRCEHRRPVSRRAASYVDEILSKAMGPGT